MEINFNKRDPVYVQVIDYFKQQIALGRLTAGEEIPSRRELANELKINPNTAQRAYKEMEEAGLIHTESNQPSKVTKDAEILTGIRKELISEAAVAFAEAMKRIDVSLEECVSVIEKTYDQLDEGEGEVND